MRFWLSPKVLVLACLLGVPGRAVTLEEIEDTPNLTPESFARFFSAFEFKYRDQIQAPEIFLASQSGDCDDYATLAAEVLRKKGYTPRLISIRMPNVVHVVCYIEETRSYLDYNIRAAALQTVSCGPEIAKIATLVAKSYKTRWTSASEFTFRDGEKRLVQTVVDTKDKLLAFLLR